MGEAVEVSGNDEGLVKYAPIRWHSTCAPRAFDRIVRRLELASLKSDYCSMSYCAGIDTRVGYEAETSVRGACSARRSAEFILSPDAARVTLPTCNNAPPAVCIRRLPLRVPASELLLCTGDSWILSGPARATHAPKCLRLDHRARQTESLTPM